MNNQFADNAIFWIEVEKINPNPYQPRKEFDETALRDLSDSIKMYGVLQPLVVTRREEYRDDGGMNVTYELISGERRWRASRLAGLKTVPALIRQGTDDAKLKLELAIIENLQREDLNVVERARSFYKLIHEFGMKQFEVAQKVQKSREYVNNTLRILALPEEILTGLSQGKITEGHTRPLLMLSDRPQEQLVLFKEIVYKKISVREAEKIARRIAVDRVKKKELIVAPEIIELEKTIMDSLGTRVHIEKDSKGGKITIDFFSDEDLKMITALLNTGEKRGAQHMLDKYIQAQAQMVPVVATDSHPQVVADVHPVVAPEPHPALLESKTEIAQATVAEEAKVPEDDRATEDKKKEEESTDEMYSIKNFSL